MSYLNAFCFLNLVTYTCFWWWANRPAPDGMQRFNQSVNRERQQGIDRNHYVEYYGASFSGVRACTCSVLALFVVFSYFSFMVLLLFDYF